MNQNTFLGTNFYTCICTYYIRGITRYTLKGLEVCVFNLVSSYNDDFEIVYLRLKQPRRTTDTLGH